MKKYFEYDEKTLSYKKTKKPLYYQIVLGVFMAFYVMLFFDYIGKTKEIKHVQLENKHLSSINNLATKSSCFPVENQAWQDSVFTVYAEEAQLYLDRPSNQGTPLNGEMMALAARNAYDSTGIIVPVELALSQAVWESSLGREGRSPVNNPWNIGEYDSGTVMWFNSTFDGTQAYYYWMARTYLSCHTVEQLLVNFVNCNGHRYAKPGYEQKIHNSYVNIRNWLNKNKKN
jgi:hypothetical protein